ncbi:MAG: MFS transporter [Pseudomonadota bacterium]
MPTDSQSDVAPPTAAQSLTHKARPWAFGLLLMGMVCMGMGQTIVFAVLPPIARQIGLADRQVGAIFMLSAIFWVSLAPRWGRLSDGRGRRPFILIGIGGFTVSMVLFATAIRLGMDGVLSGAALYALILSMRSIYGIIGSAQPSAAQAYIADRTTAQERTKALANVGAAFGIGAMFGPAFAGATVGFGALAPLYGVAAIGAAAWLAVFFFLPEHNPPRKREAPPRVKISDPRLRAFLIFGLVAGAISAVPVQMIGFYFIDILALSNEEALAKVSFALTASAIAGLFAQLVLVRRLSLSPRTLLRTSPLILFAAHGLFAVSSSFPMLVLAATCSGLGWGMAMPGFTAAASLSVTPREQGVTAGLSNSAGASGFIIVPPIGFTLYAIDPRATFILTTLASLALIAFVYKNETISSLKAGAAR